MKSLPEETTAERVKLMSQKIKIQKTGTGIKILSPNKLLTKLPVLLAQVKAGNILAIRKTKSNKYYTGLELNHQKSQ